MAAQAAVALLLALLATAASAQQQDPAGDVSRGLAASQVPSLDQCKESFEKFLLTINVPSQMANPDLLSCVGSASESCCRAIETFVGSSSPIYGCSCHAELHDEAWDMVYELAPVVAPSSNLAYIPVARPVVMQRIKECGIPTPKNGMCPDLTEPSSGASAASVVTVDPAEAAQGSSLVVPNLNRTAAMMEYSAAYERTLEGFDEYGWYNPCQKLEGAKYCLASLQAPGNYMQVRYGVCVPEDAEEDAIADAIADTEPEHYAKHPPRVDCSVMDKTPLGAGGIATAAVLGSILLAVAVATAANLVLPRAEEAGALRRTADCFDFCRNWHQLMAKPQMGRELDLTTLNGFRAVSMFWVILGHTLSYIVWIGGIAYPGRLINPNNMNMVLHEWFISIYAGAFFAVDTFFFLSGLLVAFIVSREISKAKLRAKTVKGELGFWALYAVNRFARLLPTFAAVLFFFWQIAPSLSSSPLWKLNWDQHSQDCQKYWWSDLFFMNNFYPVGNPADGLAPTTCVGGTWYLAVDTQLYLFVAPVVIAAWHHGLYLKPLLRVRRAVGASISAALLAISVALACYTTIQRDVWLQYFGEGNFYYYYVKPWIRAPPYVLGLLLGLVFHEISKPEGKGREAMRRLKERTPSWAWMVLFCVSVATLSLLVFPIATYYNTDDPIPPVTTTHSAGWSRDATIAYNTVKFLVWGLALCALVLPTCLGKLKLVTELLGGHIWAPLAKLTYGAYLIHMLYPQALLTSTDATTAYYHTSHTLGMWLVFTVGSYFWAAILHLVVEAPFGNLQKLAFSAARSNPKRSSVAQDPDGVKRKKTDVQQKLEDIASPRTGRSISECTPRNVDSTKNNNNGNNLV